MRARLRSSFVIPAKAGIQWATTRGSGRETLRASGGPDHRQSRLVFWILACARTTGVAGAASKPDASGADIKRKDARLQRKSDARAGIAYVVHRSVLCRSLQGLQLMLSVKFPANGNRSAFERSLDD